MTVDTEDRERGAGLIGAMAGVLVFLAFLLFAVQLLVNLYTTSIVTNTAYEGARLVAGDRAGDHGDSVAVAAARTRAEQKMRELLGRQADRTTFDWSQSTADTVVLRVRSDPPRFLLPGLGGGGVGFDHIDRTVRVRVEELR